MIVHMPPPVLSAPSKRPRPAGYLESRSFQWPDWSVGPWSIELDFAEADDGRVICCGASIHLSEGGLAEELTATQLRSVPLGALVRWHRQDSTLFHERLAELSPLIGDGFADLHAGYKAGSPRRGRPSKWSREHFQEVAEVYARAYLAGENPTRAIQDHAAWGPVSHSQAAKWVARARELHFLDPTTERRGGGIPEPLRRALSVQRVKKSQPSKRTSQTRSAATAGKGKGRAGTKVAKKPAATSRTSKTR
jgi:hypothetical protein